MDNGFLICDELGNEVDLMKVDKMLSERFQLDYTYKDFEPYGSFVFPETIEERGIGQDSISWAGLLHCVAYYSSISYGRKTKYEILGALHEMMELACELPCSVVQFMEELLDFIDSKKFYVSFTYSSIYDRIPVDEHCFAKGGRATIYRNVSGLFECDFLGRLLSFFPDAENLLTSQGTLGQTHLRQLLIPDCIVDLSPNGIAYLQRFPVVDYIELPKSWYGKDDLMTMFKSIVAPDAKINYRQK